MIECKVYKQREINRTNSNSNVEPFDDWTYHFEPGQYAKTLSDNFRMCSSPEDLGSAIGRLFSEKFVDLSEISFVDINLRFRNIPHFSYQMERLEGEEMGSLLESLQNALHSQEVHSE